MKEFRTSSELSLSRAFKGILSLLAVAIIVALFFRLQPRLALGRSELRVSLSQIPYYTFCSLYRVLIAYFLSLIFAISYGITAARTPLAERIMIPIIDVAQSVPVIGFFPAAIYFFISLGGNTRFGIELASIFLIFTSQAWNMALGVFEAIKTIPTDIAEAVAAYGGNGWLRFKRLFLPASIPKLVYNSILSWVAAWYFLIACEIITIGDARYKLPGLGTLLMDSAETGQVGPLIAGLLALLFVIVTMDFLVWQPLSVWAEKFRYEFAAGTLTPQIATIGSPLAPFVLRLVRAGASVVRLAWGVVKARMPGWYKRSISALLSCGALWRAIRRVLGGALIALVLYGAGDGLVALIRVLRRPWPAQAHLIPLAAGASILRLMIAYALSLAWTLPCALAASESQRFSRRLAPIAQIAGSIPATALFPLIVAAVVELTGNMNLASVLLLLTGMQWYLLFNLTAGVRQIPEDLREAVRAFGLSRTATWRKLTLPALTPSLITGSITAWGGGWNALIVSEYFTYQGHHYQVLGLGAMLDVATYQSGDNLMILLALLSMVAIVMSLNRLVWRPLYRFATERYRFD